MAYMNQEMKTVIAANLKKVMPKDWKYSLRIHHHSKIVLCIAAAPVDIIAELEIMRKANAERYGRDYHPIQGSHAEVRAYGVDEYFPKDSAITPILVQAMDALRSAGWYDNSDGMTDYFDTAYYYEIEIGRWDKPFVCTAPQAAIAAETTPAPVSEESPDAPLAHQSIMHPGDRVNWTYRPRGGYSYTINVAGVIKKLTAKRATIEVARKVGDVWQKEQRSVSLEKLTPRTKPSPELGE